MLFAIIILMAACHAPTKIEPGIKTEPPFLREIYKPFTDVDVPIAVSEAITNCRSQCSYTVLTAKVFTNKKLVPAICNHLCLKDIVQLKDMKKFVALYDKPVPKRYFNEWVRNKRKAKEK
jgi:hypothetical protein